MLKRLQIGYSNLCNVTYIPQGTYTWTIPGFADDTVTLPALHAYRSGSIHFKVWLFAFVSMKNKLLNYPSPTVQEHHHLHRGSLESLQYVCICIAFCQNSRWEKWEAEWEVANSVVSYGSSRLSLLMVCIIQVPSRHAFRNSFAWGNGEQRPGF